MSPQEATDRVVIFIDGSNLYHALEQNCGRMDLDFTKFVARLTGERRMVRIYYYNVLQDQGRNPEGFREQQKFLTSLYNTPYLEVRLGSTRQREGVTVEKGVDVMLAVDLVSYSAANIYDVGIVVSGDADYAYAVQTVKNHGKHVELAAFESNASQELLLVVDNRHFLDRDFFRDLWIGQSSGGAHRPAPRREEHAPLKREPERAPSRGRERDRRRRRPPFRRETVEPGATAPKETTVIPGVPSAYEPPAPEDDEPLVIEPPDEERADEGHGGNGDSRD